MFCLILLVLLFSRRWYWNSYHPYGYGYSPYGYGYPNGTYPYGAYSYYNPQAPYNPVYCGGYGYRRPYGYW